jgi:hypothetical protein
MPHANIWIRRSNWDKWEKTDNKSKLINRLLKEHFDNGPETTEEWSVPKELEAVLGIVATPKQYSIPDQLKQLGLLYDPTLSGMAFSEETQQYIKYKVKDGEVILK